MITYTYTAPLKKIIINLIPWTMPTRLFSDICVIRTFSPAHAHTHSEQAWCWRHTLAQSQLSGMKRSILFSMSNLGVLCRICAWTICTCCQVCVKISNAPVVLMAGLWIVSMAMVKRRQADDVRWWVHPKEIASVCACILRCVQSPLSTPCFLVPEERAAVWAEGQCQILLSSSTVEGFGGVSSGILQLL